jgi:hypothetical protein
MHLFSLFDEVPVTRSMAELTDTSKSCFFPASICLGLFLLRKGLDGKGLIFASQLESKKNGKI